MIRLFVIFFASVPRPVAGTKELGEMQGLPIEKPGEAGAQQAAVFSGLSAPAPEMVWARPLAKKRQPGGAGEKTKARAMPSPC